MMKTMTGIAFALAVLSASPASAQAFQGNWWDAYHSFGHQNDAYNAYAAYPEARRQAPRRAYKAPGRRRGAFTLHAPSRECSIYQDKVIQLIVLRNESDV